MSGFDLNTQIQEEFHVYLNKYEIAISHLFPIIFSNNEIVFG